MESYKDNASNKKSFIYFIIAVGVFLMVSTFCLSCVSNNSMGAKDGYVEKRLNFEINYIYKVDLHGSATHGKDIYIANVEYNNKEYIVRIPTNEILEKFERNEVISMDCYYNAELNDVDFIYVAEFIERIK